MEAIVSSDDRRSMKGAVPPVEDALLQHAFSSHLGSVAPSLI